MSTSARPTVTRTKVRNLTREIILRESVRVITINVTDENGTLLDTATLTREEFFGAQRNPVAAQALLNELQIGSAS